MGPKIFSVREANSQIPRLEELLYDLDRVRDRLRYLKGKLDVLEMLWGEEIQSESNPDRNEFLHYTEELEKAKGEYEQCARRFTDLDVVLKSVDTGLVDFYGVIEGRLVFLCWKRGEKTVEYYHHMEDGFAGRQPIPSGEMAR